VPLARRQLLHEPLKLGLALIGTALAVALVGLRLGRSRSSLSDPLGRRAREHLHACERRPSSWARPQAADTTQEEPHGEEGFWTRLLTLQPDALFVWGRHDRLVPVAFARHVAEALPRARHLELDCGHLPQVERPRQTHAALAAFLSGASDSATGVGARRGR
jgi:pimeloyl-ACP methyl ester carboxylesterase